MPGLEPNKVEMALNEDLYDLRREGLKTSMIIGYAGRALFKLYPDICFTAEENHGKSHLGSVRQRKQLLRHKAQSAGAVYGGKTAYLENRTKPINTPCGLNAEQSTVKNCGTCSYQ
jgi:hypothetical protein